MFYLNKKIHCLSAIFIISVLSEYCNAMEVIRIGNREIAVEEYRKSANEKYSQIIEKRCLVVACKATAVLKNGISLSLSEKNKFAKELTGGKNPGSVLCSHFLEGIVLMGIKKDGSMQSYCQFKDKSLISTHSIRLTNNIR